MIATKAVARIIVVFSLLLAMSSSLLEVTPAQAQTATTWYVTTNGNNANTCSNSGAPCLTINGALNKATAGDIIEVAIGTYTGTGTEVVAIDKAITLSGGWDVSFTSQNGLSTIDGQTTRQGLIVYANPVLIDRFNIQNGMTDSYGAGISNSGVLTLNNSVISHNTSLIEGGGISNGGMLTINNSTISENTAGNGSDFSGNGAGIGNREGGVLINNSTIHNNFLNNHTVDGGGSGISNGNGSISLYNSTVSHNTGGFGVTSSGIGYLEVNNSTITGNTGGITATGAAISNSIIAGNITTSGKSIDCNDGYIESGGYNLIGGNLNCTFIAVTGDQIGDPANPINAGLGPLQDNGGPTFTHAVLGGSPALNAGNPIEPGSTSDTCPATDQRGTDRIDKAPCDIGAYEATGPMILSIKRADPNPTVAASVTFTVTFSDAVTGVDETDFLLTTPGLTGTSITNVSGAYDTYTVTINTGSTDGYIHLDIVDDDSIINAEAGPLGGAGSGNGNSATGEFYTVGNPAPTVLSIVRKDIEHTSSNSVDFYVTFSEPVTDPVATDFNLTTTGVTGAAITDISLDHTATYLVTVNTGSDDGTIRLDVVDDDTILDTESSPLGGTGTGNGDFATGESYTIDKTAPTVLSITLADANPTSAGTVHFTVTFSEPVLNADATSFKRITAGLGGTSITNVSHVGAVYTVTVNTGLGSGTLHINLVNTKGNIKDFVSNNLLDDFADGETYTINKPVSGAGLLDPTFGVHGITTTDVNDREGLSAIAIQPDGKIVSIGAITNTYSHLFQLERYNADGSLDNTFNDDGIMQTSFGYNFQVGDDVAIAPDGKIFASGFTDAGVALVRYTSDGVQDTTFSQNGFVVSPKNIGFYSSIAILPNGQIILAGDGPGANTDHVFILERYNTNGTLDKTFGTNGTASTDFGSTEDHTHAIVLQPDGKIVVAGDNSFTNFALARYNANGSLDTSFGNQGKVKTNFAGLSLISAEKLALQPDGKIVVVGSGYDGTNQTGLLVRYNTNGSLDPSFDHDGKIAIRVGESTEMSGVVVQPNGNIAVSGTTNDATRSSVLLLRYTNSGALDTGYGTDGIVLTPIGDGAGAADMELQPNGKIIVAGNSVTDDNPDFMLARYNTEYAVVKSAALQDGWILESGESSQKGGSINSNGISFNLGDNAAKRQYVGILSFATGPSLPDTAVITEVLLKIKKQTSFGSGDPVNIFQGFMADLKNGTFGSSQLQASDFQAIPEKTYGPFKPALIQNWYTLNLTKGKTAINKLDSNGGLTQIRLRFKLDDNNDAVANILSLYSGNAPATNRPQLVITYYVP